MHPTLQNLTKRDALLVEPCVKKVNFPMPFLTPSLLGLLAFASVPIIIHLLNRRRFQRIDWAPMKYLKLTIKTNRRRLRIEQLILLAVRTLLIIVLICAIARPVLSATGLGAWLSGSSRMSRIIVIDDSLSMGYQTDRRSAMESARAAAAEVVKKIGTQDSVTAFSTSFPANQLVHEAHIENPDKLISDINKLTVTATRSDWAGTFKSIDQALAGAAFPTREVTIITDMRKTGWSAAISDTAARWSANGVAVTLVDVGSSATANVALLSFELEDPVVLPGAEVKVHAMIRNDTANNITGAQAVLSVGEQARQVILPELLAGKVTDVPLLVSVQKPGQLPVKFELPADGFPDDNRRWLMLNVRPSLELSLIDGDPSSQPFESAADFLALAFSVGAEPWHVDKRTDSDWASARFQTSDVLVLANLSSISPERIAELEQKVTDGMGLMIFAGEQVDPVLYNQRLYKEGSGLLPVRLEKPIDEPVTGLVVEQLDQSPLSSLSRIAPAALARIRARKFMSVILPARTDNVRVLARWNDAAAHPAVIEKRFGKGRVIFWTVSANKQWSDWPIDPTYVLGVRSAAMSIARTDAHTDHVAAGSPLRYILEEGLGATEIRIAAPGKDQSETAFLTKPDKGPAYLSYAQTVNAGAYNLSWKDSTGKANQHSFVVNSDRAESELTPIAESELRGYFGGLKPTIIHYVSGKNSLASQGREIWRMFAYTLLALLVFETIFAVWVGREQ